MNTINAGRLPLDNATIRACGKLLRDFDAGSRLRSNSLLGQTLLASDRSAIACAITAALSVLTERQREILERCDMHGQPYAAVAKSLFISERHLFRERRTALERIAQTIIDHRQVGTKIDTTADAFEGRVSMAEALANAGRWQTAAELLQRLADDVSADRRPVIEMRLARIYRDADRFDAAYQHARIARALAVREPNVTAWRKAEADVSIAAIAVDAGNWSLADQLAPAAIAELRAWPNRSADPRIQSAFIGALLVQGELSGSRGVDSAFGVVSEAFDAASQSVAIDPRVAIRAGYTYAMTNFLRGRETVRAEETLWDCYCRALSHGLARESLAVAAGLSSCYRTSGRPSDATRLLVPLLGAAREAGTGWVRTAILSELTYASIASGTLAHTERYLSELEDSNTHNLLSRAGATQTRAALRIAQRNFGPALEAAIAAQSAYTQVGQQRMVGTSLRLQAEALHGLGRRDPALRAITLAIDALEHTSHPTRLAKAYRVMASISGQPRFATVAHKLLREFQTSRQNSSVN